MRVSRYPTSVSGCGGRGVWSGRARVGVNWGSTYTGLLWLQDISRPLDMLLWLPDSSGSLSCVTFPVSCCGNGEGSWWVDVGTSVGTSLITTDVWYRFVMSRLGSANSPSVTCMRAIIYTNYRKC